MNNPNRYEEVPQKENKFAKGFKAFGNYIKYVFVDFFNSFKYNNMKLASILFALPGVLLGFFMFAHYPTINHIVTSYTEVVEGTNVFIKTDLNEDTEDATDYKLFITNYSIADKDYTDISLALKTVNTEDASFNQNNYPINGYATSESTTKQLTAPTVTLTETQQDSFKLTVSGLTSDELNNVASYSLFVYKYVNGLPYRLTDLDKYGLVVEDGSLDISIKSLAKSDDSNKYAIAVKAIAKSGEYYSSNMTDFIEFKVVTSGSDYDSSKNMNFLPYQGEYEVVSAGQALDDNLKSFVITINSDGSAVYTVGSNKHNVNLSLGGGGLESKEIKEVNILPFDFSGIAIFVLTLFGFLSVFISLDLSKKKNFGSVIKATLIFLVIAGVGALYVYSIFATEGALASGKLKLQNVTTLLDTNGIISMVSVIAAIVFSLAGIILSFINYDRTYEKVDR